MNKPIYLTPAGKEKLQEEYEHLIGPKRQEISARLRVAIQQGDLKENADYIATKEEQGFVEGRIQELEVILRDAVLIKEFKNKGIVEIGANVTIQEEGYDPEEYHVVGANEANPREGRISNESPIGSALMGKKVGDEIIVSAPGGDIRFKVIEIN